VFGFLKRHWVGASMTAVAVAVVAAILAWLIWPDADNMPETNRSDIGAGVTVVDGTPPDGLKAEMLDDQPLPFWQDYVTILSPMVDVSPSGSLDEPLTLRFELDEVVAQEQRENVHVLTWDEQGDSNDPNNWEYLDTEISADGRYATVTIEHLSWFTTIFLNVGKLLDDVGEELFGALTGDLLTEAEEPECENEDAAREDGYVIDSSAKDTLYWCFGIENDQRILRVVNRQNYPLSVEYTGLTLEERDAEFSFQQIAKYTPDGSSVLLPYETATYSLDLEVGEGAGLSTEFSGYAQSLYRLDVAVQVLVAMMTKLGSDAISDTAYYSWELIDTLLSNGECGVATFQDDFAKAVTTCIPWDMMLELVGPKAVLLWPLVAASTLANYLLSEVESVYDMLNGYDEYQVWIEREELTPCLTAEEFMEAFRQVHIDGFYQLKEPIICEDGWAYAGVSSFLGHPDDWYEGTTEYSDPAHTVFHLEDGVWVLKRYGGTGTEWVEYYPECLEYPASLFEQMCHDE
jgi:hypothetical protein